MKSSGNQLINNSSNLPFVRKDLWLLSIHVCVRRFMLGGVVKNYIQLRDSTLP